MTSRVKRGIFSMLQIYKRKRFPPPCPPLVFIFPGNPRRCGEEHYYALSNPRVKTRGNLYSFAERNLRPLKNCRQERERMRRKEQTLFEGKNTSATAGETKNYLLLKEYFGLDSKTACYNVSNRPSMIPDTERSSSRSGQ